MNYSILLNLGENFKIRFQRYVEIYLTKILIPDLVLLFPTANWKTIFSGKFFSENCLNAP